MNTQSASLPLSRETSPGSFWLTSVVGFFFAFRLFIMLLAVRVFQADAKAGTALSLLLNYILFTAVTFYSFGPATTSPGSNLQSRSFRWVIFFFVFSFCSLTWTGAASLPAACSFWAAMAADTAMVVLFLRTQSSEAVIHSLFSGFIAGTVLVAIIAWIMPAQSDLRLGDEELLGPNQIGYLCAFAVFLAQYLIASGDRAMKYAVVFLSVTLLRTFSKTTLVAFAITQLFLLLRDRDMSRRTKFIILGVTAIVLLVFSGIISSYFTLYANTGNSPETLTGRLGIWVYFLGEGVENLFFGHGFHSVWNVIPLFGQFEARHAHNELIEQFYVYGLCGVFMLIGLYGSFFREIRHLRASPLKTLGIGLLLFAIIRGFADTEPFDLSLPLWMMALLGIAAKRTYPLTELTA